MIKAYNEKISQLSFDLDPISLPIQIENPFNPNKMIVYKIKKEFQIYGNSYLTKHQSRQEEKSHIKVKQDTKEIAYIIPHLESTEDYTDTRNLPSKSKNPWLYAKSKFGDYPEPTENSGKWLIFVERKDIDKIWEKIRKWLIAGLLSKYAKVSTVSKLKPSNKTSHVICVFTYDWTDEKDVMDIRKKLRDIGFTQKIPYKTDKDTRKGKYHSGYSTQISKYFE
jgi:hypothetical protein